MVVRWHKLVEVENECTTSHKFILFAIFVSKIIYHSWWKFEKVLTKIFLHSFFCDTVYNWMLGTDCVVEVTGHFCCVCRELWRDGEQALTKHCSSEKHRLNYEVYYKLTFPCFNLAFVFFFIVVMSSSSSLSSSFRRHFIRLSKSETNLCTFFQKLCIGLRIVIFLS